MSKLKPTLSVIPICVICFLISVISSYASEESLTITTYYPSPYGSYRELRSQRIAIGEDYINGGTYCWEGTCTNTINTDADLVVEGNVGIGTVSPQAPLDVVNGIQIQTATIDSRTGLVLRNPNGFASIYTSGVLGNGLGFYTNSDESPANTRMYINSTGNVGIGTVNPTAVAAPNGATTSNLDVNDVWLRGANKWASDDSQGVWCGLDPAGGGSVLPCKGVAPESGCPAGYIRVSFSVEGGTLQSSFNGAGYTTVHYTCIKN